MADDAAFLAGEIAKLADAGARVVVISHSYGGIPATECVKGLSVKERRAEGKEGGVVRLGYMTALVPEVGQAAQDVLNSTPRETRQAMTLDVRAHDPINCSLLY